MGSPLASADASDVSFGSSADVEDTGSSGASSGKFDDCKVIVMRRYCIIYDASVPDAYFAGGADSQACRDVDAVVRTHIAHYTCAGFSLVEHEYAQGVDPYNVKEEEGELWCNIPEDAVTAVVDALGDKLEDVFEEFGFEDL